MAQVRFNSFPSREELPTNANVKVPAIKVIRAILDMGLKEAKDLVEGLQSGTTSEVFAIDLTDERKVHLDKFKELGGSFSMDDGLNAKIRRIMDEAIDKGAFPMAHDLLDVLAKYS